jgi:hypothetical protein
MFHEDGTMRKSCKSDLVKQFENEVSPILSLPDFDPLLTTYIRDDAYFQGAPMGYFD